MILQVVESMESPPGSVGLAVQLEGVPPEIEGTIAVIAVSTVKVGLLEYTSEVGALTASTTAIDKFVVV